MTYFAAARSYQFLGLFLIVFIVSLGYGISFPQLSIMQEHMGRSGLQIGLNSAMPALGWIMVSIFFPRLQSRWALRRILIGSLLVPIAATIAFQLDDAPLYWMIVRLGFGGGLGLFFLSVEFYINTNCTVDNRGRNIAIYNVFFLLGLGLGPALQAGLQTQTMLAFALIAALFIIAIPALMRVRLILGDTSEPSDRAVWAVFWIVPAVFITVFAYGYYEDIPAYLMSIFALRNGMSETTAALTLSAAAFGALLFSVPIGVLSDRMNRLVLLTLIAIITAILTLGFAFMDGRDGLFLTLVFIWAGMGSAIYNLALSIIGDVFKGAQLAQANALFLIFYALGSVIGPPLNGAAIDLWHTNGMLVSVIVIFGVVCLAALWLRPSRGNQ